MSDSNWARSSDDNRTMNLLFMIGLRPNILVRTTSSGQKCLELINSRLTRH